MTNVNFRAAIILISCLFMSVSYAETIESLVMPGPVIEGHAKYEQQCNKCHTLFKRDQQSRLCRDCHEDIDKDISKRSGYHGLDSVITKTDCQVCHIEHQGRTADIIKLDKNTFDHNKTNFKLKHAHNKIRCNDCHKANDKYRKADAKCYACHKKDDNHKGKLGKECQRCHNEKSWSSISFDHDKTEFSLTGKHAKTDCNSCHINNDFSNTPVTCYACHSIDDVHRGKNGKDCKKCHNARSWKKLKFDHDKDTKFKLTGRHKKTECQSCHKKNPYKVKIKSDCLSCHKHNDKHNTLYGEKCHSCHNTNAWSKYKFNHQTQTDFELKGKHRKIQCYSCHTGHLYKQKLSVNCIDCHKNDDVHDSRKGTKCEQCHGNNSWKQNINFDHDLSRFPLLGLHAITSCEQCHINQQYSSTASGCNDCHIKDDIHKAGLGKECQRCHNPNGWKIWRFDHNKESDFKLKGAHKKVHCSACHANDGGVKPNSKRDCGHCHSVDDIHNGQFGRRCQQCHNTRSFQQVDMSGFSHGL